MRAIRILLLIFLLGAFNASAQTSEYRYHSLFLYTFTKYIQWPANYQNADFTIGVYGSSPIEEFLQELSVNKTVGTQKIIIKKFNKVSEISKCHMIFIPASKSEDFDEVLQAVNGQSTLLVTEKAGLGKKGSGINFVMIDGKVKFELNKAATEKSNLKVSADLSKLAIEV